MGAHAREPRAAPADHSAHHHAGFFIGLARANYQHVLALEQKNEGLQAAVERKQRTEETERRLIAVHERGITLRATLVASTDNSMSVEDAKRLFNQWRAELRSSVTEGIGSGAAVQVDSIPTVMAMSMRTMSQRTAEEKVNLILHVDERLKRLQ